MSDYDELMEEQDFEFVLDGMAQGYWEIECSFCKQKNIVGDNEFHCECSYCNMILGHPLDYYSDILGLDN